MIFFYYNYKTQEFIHTTNLQAVSDLSRIEYSKLYRMISNGSPIVNNEEFLLCKGPLKKGKQRVKEIKKEGKIDKKNFGNFFDKV